MDKKKIDMTWRDISALISWFVNISYVTAFTVNEQNMT